MSLFAHAERATVAYRKAEYLLYKVADICNVHSHFELAIGELPGAQGIIHISTACNHHLHHSGYFERSLTSCWCKYAISDIHYHQHRLKLLS